MIGADPAYLAFISRSRSPGAPDDANTGDALGGHPRNNTAVQSVVVVCDGTLEGDNATQLAAAVARNTAASVRAVTWLTPAVARSAADLDNAPIEEMLDRVTQQLYRCTANPGFWRLALVTGDFAPGIARATRNDHVDLMIMPGGTLGGADLPNRLAWTTRVPVACVFGSMGRPEYSVRITTIAQSASQRLARLAASVIAMIFRRQSGAPASVPAPVEIRTLSTRYSAESADTDDIDVTNAG